MSFVVTRRPHRWDGFGVATRVDISAPPSTVWTAIMDIDNLPSILTTVKSTERIDGSRKGDQVRAGTRWRENRRVEGGDVSSTLVCTSIDDGGSPESYPKSMSIITDLPGTTSTGTLTVEATGASSRLVVSFAMAPSTFGSKVFTTIFGRLIDRFAVRHVQVDMTDIAAACERGDLDKQVSRENG